VHVFLARFEIFKKQDPQAFSGDWPRPVYRQMRHQNFGTMRTGAADIIDSPNMIDSIASGEDVERGLFMLTNSQRVLLTDCDW
jgi:hypothetical protein